MSQWRAWPRGGSCELTRERLRRGRSSSLVGTLASQQRSRRTERLLSRKPLADPGEAWVSGLVLKLQEWKQPHRRGCGKERRKARFFIFLFGYAWSRLWHMGSLPAARGVYVPDQGSDPRPPALGTQSLGHWATREVPRLDSNKEERKEARLQGMRSGPGQAAPPRFKAAWLTPLARLLSRAAP